MALTIGALPGLSYNGSMPDTASNPSSETGTDQKASALDCRVLHSNGTVKDRAAAWRLLNEHTQSASLLKHALGVEVCVRAYGEKHAAELGLLSGEAHAMIETYAIAGLLHDFDYEKHPSAEEHPWIGNQILTEQGWAEEIRHAILAHAEYTRTPRVSHLDKALFACDELAGFLTANALVKPTKSILDVNVASVRKKMKDKAFARGVNREDIANGAAELGVDLEQHIAFCLAAMQKHAGDLGLAGSATNPQST